MSTDVVIDYETMCRLTGDKDRNIYIHKNPLARHIFWTRLQCLAKLMSKYVTSQATVADVGGGSGAFLPALSSLFTKVDVIDLDCSDAKAIAGHFQLSNVRIYETDMNDLALVTKYQAVVFADVLEHFSDLNVPIDWVKKHLTTVDESYVAVSLPTENFIYELGRAVLRKSKPIDHFHSSRAVLSAMVDSGFVIVDKVQAPRFIFEIPLFDIAILKLDRGAQ